MTNIYRSSEEKSLFSQFNESSKDNRILLNCFRPILSYLVSYNIIYYIIPDFSNLLKLYSLKDKMHTNPESNKMINKEDFTSFFIYLFEKTKDTNYILKRSLNRMNYKQRNILFAYFSVKYEKEMHDIAYKYFSCIEFHYKINNKVELSETWHKYIDDLNSHKCFQTNSEFKNDQENHNQVPKLFSISSLILQQEPSEIKKIFTITIRRKSFN